MKSGFRVLIICFTLVFTILLGPVFLIRAEEDKIFEGSFNEEVPYMNGISVELIRFDFNPFNYVFAETNKQSHIKRIEFRYDKDSDVYYSEYEFIFDFTLKTQLSDGSLVDTKYKYVIDGDSKEGSVSQLDSILVWFGLKDDYFSWSFNYEDLVKKSPVCEEKKDFLSQKSFNTVVSSVDCYVRRKADLNYGLVSHFDFVWYEDFYKQNCSKISYSLLKPDVNEVLDTNSVENHKFAGSLDSDGKNLFYGISSTFNDILGFFVDLPAAIIAFLTGFWDVINLLNDLILLVFPFVPSGFIMVLIIMIFIILVIAIYKLVQGWFG